MNDDAIERELRGWLDTHAEPEVPASLRQFLLDLPRTETGLHRVQRQPPILARAPRRDVALVLVTAAVAVAVMFGASLIIGSGPPHPAVPTASPSAESTSERSSPEASLPIAVVPSPHLAAETIRFAGFANREVGWALTDHRLRLTSDGGTTWRTAGPPIDYGSYAPKGVSFFDADHGWVVSEDSFSSSLNLWQTADGGLTWAKTVLPPVPMPAETVGDATTDWIDATHAVIDVAGGMPNGYLDGLLVTADGGATWSAPAMQSTTAGADGITGVPGFLDPATGWLAGGAPGTRLWMTRDGGETWTLQALAVPAGYLDDQGGFWGAPRFFSATDGVVARTFDNNTSTVLEIYRTSDGGLTWQPVIGPTPKAASWSFPSIGSWILWDSQMIWRSTDQGQSWMKSVSSGLPGTPVMTDDLHGWGLSANGSASSLYVTSDGGSTWTAVDSLAPLSPSPTSSNATAAAALQTATKYEAARASGDWTTAWALLSAYSKESIGALADFERQESAYNAAGGSTYHIDPPTQDPDLLSATYLGAVYTDVLAASDAQAWIVVVEHPDVRGASAATTTLVVAPVGDGWAVWIGH